MPGPVSDQSPGPGDDMPYLPSWLYPNGPKMCPCGHHEGYHDEGGTCLLTSQCGCTGLPASSFTSSEEM